MAPNARATQIADIVDALKTYWLAHPEMRFGQIAANAAAIVFGEDPSSDLDPYYMSDDDFVRALADLASVR